MNQEKWKANGAALLQHMVKNPTGCDDRDCELHNADVAIAEEVWDDMAKVFFLAGWHACLNYTSGSIDAWCDELTKAQFRLLRIRIPTFDPKFPQS